MSYSGSKPMIAYPIKVLLVERDADQLLLTERALKRINRENVLVGVKSEMECLEALSQDTFAVVIVDYSPPEIDGLELIRRIVSIEKAIPVVMVTGQGDEQVAVKAMKDGASDYVVKTQGYLKSLPGILEKAIEKQELQNQLKLSEEKYARLAENANDLIFTTDQEGHFTFLTNRIKALLGYSVEELLGKDFKDFLSPLAREHAEREFHGDGRGHQTRLLELDFLTKKGECKSIELGLTTLLHSGRITGFEAIGRDITQRKLLEKELVQKNKELTTLLSVTSTVSHSLNTEEIASLSIERICEFTGLNCGAVYTLRFTDSVLVQSGSFDLPERLEALLAAAGFWDEILGTLLENKEPLIHPDDVKPIYRDLLQPLAQLCRSERIQSFIILPLLFKERLFGFMFGGSSTQSCFPFHDLEILKSICDQISAAIANAGLFTAIREAKTEWETTFDAMSELICMQDVNGKIIRVNKAMARRLNSEPRQLVNRKAVDVFQDPLSPWCHHQRTEIYVRDKIVSVEFEDRLLSGVFEIATTPIYTSDGRLFAWLFVGKDITEQRQLQNQFVQVERLKALGEMASGVAHDFNNVLAGILGKTQVMLDQMERQGGMDPLTWKQNLKTIERQAIQGSQTVKRIQDFTRIRTDKKFDAVDVNQIIQASIGITRPVWKDECEAKGIRIEMQFQPAEVPPVLGIKSELTEVMVNILSNSIDAMSDGGCIQISAMERRMNQRNLVEVAIKDTGAGMSNEVRRKVFDPFFSTKGPKGTGLGLSVAYGVISRHHGTITLESELGKGTTCIIRLPSTQRTARLERQEPPLVSTEKARILVIDDEDVIREFMLEMLVASNYKADVAATGPEGIALFEKNNYNLVFSDLGLPDMSGWEVARVLKAKKPEVPIVLLSGWGIQLDDVRIKECGIDMVLSKPCQIQEILGAVDDVLGRQRKAQA